MVRFGASYCSQVICFELSWQPPFSATMRSQKTSSREFSSHCTCSHICELALTAVSWRVAKECSTETWKKIVQRKVWLLWRENCCLKVCFHEEVVSKRWTRLNGAVSQECWLWGRRCGLKVKHWMIQWWLKRTDDVLGGVLWILRLCPVTQP